MSAKRWRGGWPLVTNIALQQMLDIGGEISVGVGVCIVSCVVEPDSRLRRLSVQPLGDYPQTSVDKRTPKSAAALVDEVKVCTEEGNINKTSR